MAERTGDKIKESEHFYWLFDVELNGFGVDLIVIDGQSEERNIFRRQFRPCFYVGGRGGGRVARFLRRRQVPISVAWARKRFLEDGSWRRVLRVSFVNPFDYCRWSREIINRFGFKAELYNIDINPVSQFFYETDLYSLCKFRLVGEKIEVLSDRWAIDFEYPVLRILRLSVPGLVGNPRYGVSRNMPLEAALFSTAGETPQERELDLSPEELIEYLNSLLETEDIDILMTEYGDEFIMPNLLKMAARAGEPLRLNRFYKPGRNLAKTKQQIYFSYGKVYNKPGGFLLMGRWHLDTRNSFLGADSGLDGIIEVARVSQMPVQKLARTTIGTGLSSIEVSKAFEMGYLIPYKKQIPEEPKSPMDLIRSDKGGLVIPPIPGVHFNAGEIDFASMYPTIMDKHNISFETVNCSCCTGGRGEAVPGLGYHVCRRRRGIVAASMKPLLKKRLKLKKIAREEGETPEGWRAAAGQSAMKWLLVCCFGYLGFKNARFGKIEAHESTTTFGRDYLLRAKEIAEDKGFSLLYANTDSIFIKKEGARPEDYAAVKDLIVEKLEMPIDLEGVYRFVNFLPSKVDNRTVVNNRYFGIFDDGEIKVRGLEIRKHDTCQMVREFQERAVDLLAKSHNIKDYQRRLKVVDGELNFLKKKLTNGEVDWKDLIIYRDLGRNLSDYKVATWTSIAGKQLLAKGFAVEIGARVGFVLTNIGSKCHEERVKPANHFEDENESPDYIKYAHLLDEARKSVGCYGK